MTPEQIEQGIQRRNEDIERLQRMREETTNANLAYGYRLRQQRLAAEVRGLVRLRSPETVARMERARGLA